MTTAEALAELLPSESVATSSVTCDEFADRLGRAPTSVVTPGTTAEVAAVMEWASRDGIGVLPLASGLRASPVESDGPFIVLSTERLSGIETYEPADLTITAGAGTSMQSIASALHPQGQWFPFDPPNVLARSLGGLAVVGDTGPLWMGYGGLRNHVLGMTVVTGDGRVLRLGGRVVKNVAGYDLLKLMVGSRGSLGVATALCVRAFPRPAVDRVLAHTADSLAELAVVAALVGTAPVMPASCVLVDRAEALDGSPALIVRLHGAERTVESDRRSLEGHVGVAFETIDLDAPVVEDARDHALDAPVVIDATALPSRLGEMLGAIDHLTPTGVMVDAYGGRARAALPETEPGPLENARESIELLGGSLSILRAPSGTDLWDSGSPSSPDEADIVRMLRSTFDPEGVLWPALR